MILQETYIPEQTLSDTFIPITKSIDDNRTVWWIDVGQEDPELVAMRIKALKDELKQRRVPSTPPPEQKVYQPVPCYIPAGCEEEPRTTSRPTYHREQAIRRDDHYYMLKARRRIQEIEDFDRKTFGLVYGALDIWSYFTAFAGQVSDYIRGLGHLAQARTRKYWRSKFLQIAEALNHEQEKDRKAGSR